MKNLTVSALLVAPLLLGPAVHASEMDLEQAFHEASSAARKVKSDACFENKELERLVFRFKLDGQKGSDSLDVRFAFTGCRVEGVWYDHHSIPRAIRVYQGDYAGYELWVETEEGSSESYVTLLQNKTNAAWLGAKNNAVLLSQRIDFKFVSVADYREKGKKFTGSAVLFSYDPAHKADPDEPRGCQ